MDSAQAEHFRSLLLALQDSLAETVQAAEKAGETVELDQARVGRLSRMDALQAQQMALETERRNRARLMLVQRALERIEQGEYGDCLECGEPIDPRRLEADPTATRCIACAE
jgi:DnaK suppressor protein